MKLILYILLFCFIGFMGQAQTAWIEPDPKSGEFSPDKEATIFFDVTKTECADLATLGEDLYMWTWSPNELPAGNPKNNGEWNASNEILKLTDEGGGIYSYTMIPTEFYEVSVAEVYENDFSFLVKALDGSGGKTSCPEDKTEDLSVEAVPFVLDRKVFTFPDATTADSLFISPEEFITVIYDKNLEEKENILAAENYFIFLKVIGTNGTLYTYAAPNQLDNTPELAMKPGADNKYLWTVQPSKLLADLLPEDVSVETLRIQIAIEGASSQDDLVDGTYNFHYICQ